MTGLAELPGPPASPPFAAAPPELLARRTLLRRVDTKYVLPRRLLAELLAPLGRHYAALEAADRRMLGYSSLYFDTPGLDCFEAHRRRRRQRHKIRIRHYPDRELSFLELKIRQSDVITLKRRLDRPYGDNQLGPRDLEFLAAHSSLAVGSLAPQVWTHFRRLTLLSRRPGSATKTASRPRGSIPSPGPSCRRVWPAASRFATSGSAFSASCQSRMTGGSRTRSPSSTELALACRRTTPR